jgi:hypothetical protein
VFRPGRGERRQPRNQGAVRQHQFERSLDAFDKEIGAKLTVILTQFHLKYVRPLEERVAYLEAYPWAKAWFQLGRLWRATLGRWIHLEPAAPGLDEKEAMRLAREALAVATDQPSPEAETPSVPSPEPKPETAPKDRRSSTAMKPT